MAWNEQIKKNQIQVGRQSTKVKRNPLPEKDKRDCNAEFLEKYNLVIAKMKSNIKVIFDALNSMTGIRISHRDDGKDDELMVRKRAFDGREGDSDLDYNIRYEGSGYYYGTKIELVPKNRPDRLDGKIGVEMFAQFIPFVDEELACEMLDWMKTSLKGSEGEIEKRWGENQYGRAKYHGTIDNYWKSEYANDMFVNIGAIANDGSGAFIVNFVFTDFIPAGMRRSIMLLSTNERIFQRKLDMIADQLKPMGNNLMVLLK